FGRCVSVLQIDKLDSRNIEDRLPHLERGRATAELNGLTATAPGNADLKSMAQLGEAATPLAAQFRTRRQETQSLWKVGGLSSQETGQGAGRGLHADAPGLGVRAQQGTRNNLSKWKRSREERHQPRIALDQAPWR